jgi:methylmalonyl-CoA/ethylmalonyl-CoA epimerase
MENTEKQGYEGGASLIKGVNHLGIATKDLASILELYRRILPDSPIHETIIEDQKVKVASFDVGGTHLEFMEPTSPDSPIGKYLERQDIGIHHLALSTDSIEAELARLDKEGFRLIDRTPRSGMGGKKIAFLHPKSSGGILLELCQD